MSDDSVAGDRPPEPRDRSDTPPPSDGAPKPVLPDSTKPDRDDQRSLLAGDDESKALAVLAARDSVFRAQREIAGLETLLDEKSRALAEALAEVRRLTAVVRELQERNYELLHGAEPEGRSPVPVDVAQPALESPTLLSEVMAAFRRRAARRVEGS